MHESGAWDWQVDELPSLAGEVLEASGLVRLLFILTPHSIGIIP